MKDKEIIEKMAEIIDNIDDNAHITQTRWDGYLAIANSEKIAEELLKYYQPKLPEDSVILSKEEYEKLKSLYDTQQGAIMTSSIGDLPLTVEGLRKAVDEITRLIGVQTELQELNAKYYNEAKDLRRKLKQASKETAERYKTAIILIIQEMQKYLEIDEE